MADTKPEISEETKKTMTELQDSGRKFVDKKIEPETESDGPKTSVEALGQIYALMVEMRKIGRAHV